MKARSGGGDNIAPWENRFLARETDIQGTGSGVSSQEQVGSLGRSGRQVEAVRKDPAEHEVADQVEVGDQTVAVPKVGFAGARETASPLALSIIDRITVQEQVTVWVGPCPEREAVAKTPFREIVLFNQQICAPAQHDVEALSDSPAFVAGGPG